MRLKLGILMVGFILTQNTFAEMVLIRCNCKLIIPDKYLDLSKKNPNSDVIKCLSKPTKTGSFLYSSIDRYIFNDERITTLDLYSPMRYEESEFTEEVKREFSLDNYIRASKFFVECTGEKEIPDRFGCTYDIMRRKK